MKLNTTLLNTDHRITLDAVDGVVNAEVDGRTYEIEVRRVSGGDYLLLHGTNVFRLRVDSKPDSRSSFEVSFGGHCYDIAVSDPKRLRATQVAGAQDQGAAEIVSPMPGKVVRVLVEVGKQVEAGAGIMVVEAMKMQNELKSPKAGVVALINAEAGAAVNAGDVLAVIE